MIVLSNNASSTLAADLTVVAGSLNLASGTGARFPVLTADEYFYATVIAADGGMEIVKVTARTGDQLTITRAQEGTAASAFTSGARVELRITAQSITDVVDANKIYVGTSPPSNPYVNMLWVDTN